MKKLIKGIVDYRKNVIPSKREEFTQLALGQAPDTLFIACSDSRVAPNVFASTDPGDLFVVRNPGNIVPPCNEEGESIGDLSEVAALEFAIMNLNVRDIIVCGHSECGAMMAIAKGRESVLQPHLKKWLVYAEDSAKLFVKRNISKSLALHNQLSQINVLLQMEHLKSYPVVKERMNKNELFVHGWWFDIGKADVYAYEEALDQFVVIDESEAESLIKRM